MKPLTLEETKLKEEMKERCLAKGQYKDENAKAKFNMLCHLEDFENQYWELLLQHWELLQENKHEKEVIDKATNELFILKDMIYKPETREENFEIQRKISSIIKILNGKEVSE